MASPAASLGQASLWRGNAARSQRPRRAGLRMRVAAASGGGGGNDASGAGSSTQQAKSSSSSDASGPDPGLGLKAVWFGAEAFGNLIGGGSAQQQQRRAAEQQQLTREAAIAAIKEDYESNYFISGVGELLAYAPDARFADPFAGFKGTERFRRNVSNLGGMLSDVQLEVTSFEETPAGVETKWRFSAILDLPHKPRLAAAGGTRHVLDPSSHLVVEHIESWDVEPGRVVRSLLKPSAKVPSTFAEVLMQSLHDADVLGVWFCLSSPAWRAALPLSAALLLLHVFRGEGLGGWEAACYLLAVGGLGTEMFKIIRNVTGGGG